MIRPEFDQAREFSPQVLTGQAVVESELAGPYIDPGGTQPGAEVVDLTRFREDKNASGVTNEPYFAEFNRLFEELTPALIRYVQNITSSYQVAEEIVQETFLSAWVNFDSFEARPGASINSWLFTIAHNKTINQLRKKTVETVQWWNNEEQATDAILTAPASTYDPETYVNCVEDLKLIARALSRMSAKNREILELDRSGLTDAQLAKILGVTRSCVSARLNRARTMFERYVEQGRSI